MCRRLQRAPYGGQQVHRKAAPEVALSGVADRGGLPDGLRPLGARIWCLTD
jgi:hypothetical protein